jgi:uncharacterized damage-inducible protein DinB
MAFDKEDFLSQLMEIFSGSTWYGPSIQEILISIDIKNVNVKPSGVNHSIAGLLAHMIAWRTFVIEKMKKNEDFDINPDTNFPDIHIKGIEDWKGLINEFFNSQEKLLSMIQNIGSDTLIKIVPGRTYSYSHMLQGIIQHDIYHLGQISLIDKMLENQA